ncbi:hypothetical protein LTS08_004997 [Lithohypha guttulata]|nr:hypothetical protein LTS08_004997 [Lithohypha guttulata]
MDHLIGQRFSLISKSEIRYVGILHEINPEESTIALEEVFSFGTEDRPVDNFIPPSQQKFEYIVFRGSDVKDIKVAEEAEGPKQPPQQPPNDPAILNSSRPGPTQTAHPPPPGPPGPPPNRGESPYLPPNYPPPGFGGYYPPGPPPGQFGRGYGPPPGNFGPPPGYNPYGPPPGYFGPPGPGRFPPPPQQHPPPIGPPGQRPVPPSQPSAVANGPPTTPVSKQTLELPVEKTTSRNENKPSTPAPQPVAPQTVESTEAESSAAPIAPTTKIPQAQPKSNKVAPAMPFAVNQKSFTPPVSTGPPQSTVQPPVPKPAKSQAEMEEASRQAKEAVANALAKLNPQSTARPGGPPPNTVEAIAEKVSQMTTGPSAPRGRAGYRGGRGTRTSSAGQRQKMEIPQSDYDFQSANAKFNKEDLIKEAIASGSPIGETADNPIEGQVSETNGTARKDSLSANPVPAYDKKSSFFDNISSEAKDREGNSDGRINARAQRGAEFSKNMETFGQGNVDSGYRGRGRGGYRGRGRGEFRGRGGYRGQRRGPSTTFDPTTIVQN